MRRASEMDVRVDGAVVLRRAGNADWLEGRRDEPLTGAVERVWDRVAWVWTGFFALLALGLLAMGYHTWSWHSDRVAEVEATIVEAPRVPGGRRMVYEYEVDGETYRKEELQGRLSSTRWDAPGAMETVVHFRDDPERATLKFLREPFDLFIVVLAPLFVGSLALAGVIFLRSNRRLRRVVEAATHILPATVTDAIPVQGSRLVTYEGTDPQGERFAGSESVGNAEKVGGALANGAPVAVLWAGPDAHALL